MALLDDILTAVATASTTAVTQRNNAQTQATTASTTPDTTGGQCIEGFTALATARNSAAQAHEQAGRAAALLATLNLPTLVPPPNPTQLATATTQRDTAVQAATDADAAIAAAELIVRANYLKCVTQFAVDHIKSCASDALTAANTANTQADTLAANAETAALTAAVNPQLTVTCAEGLVIWKQAEAQVRTLKSLDGKAQSCVDLMNAGLATGLFPMPGPDVSTVVANAGLVGTRLADAQATEDAAFPVVLQKHDACAFASAAVQPLIDCVNASVAAASAATKNITDPLGGTPANLDVIVQRLIDAGNAAVPTMGNSCNEGVALLAQAATLITDKTTAANLPHLQDCVSQLAAAAPANPLVGTGQAAHDSAQAIINQAQLKLDPNNLATHSIWEKRLACSVPRANINLHVTDESGDDFGSGAKVTVVNFPLNTTLPVDFPSIPAGTTDAAGRVSINVPLAPKPLPLPPGAPPSPGDLPTTDAASLIFSVTHSNRASGNATIPIDHNGITFEVHIPIADTSL